MKKTLIIVGAVSFVLSGCASVSPARNDSKSEFTFDYKITNKSKDEIWKSARDYFAGAYGDSRSVFRVMDQEDGTIIGKGSASWMLLTSQCLTDYHIRFAAKDDKARLQFEIIRGAPALSQCQGWTWPTESGYQQIVNSFNAVSVGLENSLNGNGDTKSFKDF